MAPNSLLSLLSSSWSAKVVLAASRNQKEVTKHWCFLVREHRRCHIVLGGKLGTGGQTYPGEHFLRTSRLLLASSKRACPKVSVGPVCSLLVCMQARGWDIIKTAWHREIEQWVNCVQCKVRTKLLQRGAECHAGWKLQTQAEVLRNTTQAGTWFFWKLKCRTYLFFRHLSHLKPETFWVWNSFVNRILSALQLLP